MRQLTNKILAPKSLSIIFILVTSAISDAQAYDRYGGGGRVSGFTASLVLFIVAVFVALGIIFDKGFRKVVFILCSWLYATYSLFIFIINEYGKDSAAILFFIWIFATYKLWGIYAEKEDKKRNELNAIDFKNRTSTNHKLGQSEVIENYQQKNNDLLDQKSSTHAFKKIILDPDFVESEEKKHLDSQVEKTPEYILVSESNRTDFFYKLNLANTLLSEVYKNIEDGRPLRPREALRLLIVDISKIKVLAKLDSNKINELISAIYSMKLLFDPFSEQKIWDRLWLAEDLISEISDSNFKTTDAVANALALEKIKKTQEIKPVKNKVISEKPPKQVKVEKTNEVFKPKKIKPVLGISNCPSCKLSFSPNEITESHRIAIRCPNCRQLMVRQ